MPVQIIADAGSGDQKSQGYFDVQAPADYIRSRQRAFSMQWIDFYR
jgi:hypothetical protein